MCAALNPMAAAFGIGGGAITAAAAAAAAAAFGVGPGGLGTNSALTSSTGF